LSRADAGDENERMWESYAQAYDRILLRMPFYREVVARHVKAMTQAHVLRVIDIGAGTGNVTLQLVRAGREVTAVDSSPAMLACLRAKLPQGDLSNPRIIRHSAEELGQFADGSFDGASILLALYAVERPKDALQEVLRLLRPGGAIVITEPRRCFDLRALLDAAEGFLRDDGALEPMREDWERVKECNERFDPGKRPTLSSEDIFERFRSLGFERLSFEDSHMGHCGTIRGCKPAGLAPTDRCVDGRASAR